MSYQEAVEVEVVGMGVEVEVEVIAVAVEDAKRRCRALAHRIHTLTTSSHNINKKLFSDSCSRTLLRLVHSELSFLSRFSFSYSNPTPSLSVNIGHLEAVVHIIEQPFVTGVSRVCKPIPLSPSTVKNGLNSNAIGSKGVHIDIVCTIIGNPVWFIVSDRNPKYISWHGCGRNKGLRTRIQQVLDGARSSVSLKPSSIFLFFSNGLKDSVREKLRDEFGATNFEMELSDFECSFSEELEGEWIHVVTRLYQKACLIDIKVDFSGNANPKIERGLRNSLLGDVRPELPVSREHIALDLSSSLCSLILGIKLCSFDVKELEFALPDDLSGEADLINFDTTALIAIVSGISNGSTEKLLATPETELRRRFKSNFEFVIAQVTSEIENPIHVELGSFITGKRVIICETVFSEFKELISMCGGPNEKLRADHLLKHFMVVPDSPSVRMMSLPTTRKLALKNKVVFGTGDYWHAPTLTANMAFVRAISQTGMSLLTIEHRPRALTGD